MSEVKIPFLNGSQSNKADSNYFEMIKNRAFPNIEFASITTFCIIACIVFFILTRIAYPPTSYEAFLEWPSQEDQWLLDIQLVRSDKSHIYSIFTSMFMHENYKHIVGNMIFALFYMYELQYCWRPSILLALLSGVSANFMALATLEGKYLGFSGVLTGCVGIHMAVLILHCSYLKERFGNQFYAIIFFGIFVVIMIIGIAQSALVHLFGFAYGFLLGMAFYPRMAEASINENIDKLVKIFAVGFIALAILLGMIV